VTTNDVVAWAEAEYPGGNIWWSTRISMVDYAIEKSIKTYRRMAKEDKDDRTRCLREAWRLRWMLRLHCCFRRSGKNGKSIVVVPFVPKDSPLQYQDHEEY
jgi:hypothetical protein